MSRQDDHVAAFAALLPKMQVDPGHVIFHEGEKGENAFIVETGTVTICTKNVKGELVHLTTLGRGHMFGELALLNQNTRTATALTKDGCRLLVIRPMHLHQRLNKADPILKYWIEYLGNRVIDLSKRIDPDLPPADEAKSPS